MNVISLKYQTYEWHMITNTLFSEIILHVKVWFTAVWTNADQIYLSEDYKQTKLTANITGHFCWPLKLLMPWYLKDSIAVLSQRIQMKAAALWSCDCARATEICSLKALVESQSKWIQLFQVKDLSPDAGQVLLGVTVLTLQTLLCVWQGGNSAILLKTPNQMIQ